MVVPVRAGPDSLSEWHIHNLENLLNYHGRVDPSPCAFLTCGSKGLKKDRQAS
jgi:hypothetical protein